MFPNLSFSIKVLIGLLSVFFLFSSFSSLSHAARKSSYLDLDAEARKVEPFDYEREKGLLSYGSRIYKNNCQSCHGPIGVSYLSRLETPKILGLTAQQIVDRLVYYRDAESYGILLTGPALLMSRQALFLNDEQIISIARYFEELNPMSGLNLEKERRIAEERKRRKQSRSNESVIDRSLFSQ